MGLQPGLRGAPVRLRLPHGLEPLLLEDLPLYAGEAQRHPMDHHPEQHSALRARKGF